MQGKRHLWPLAALAVACALPLAANAQTPVGRDLASNCFQCHGTDGHAVKGLPSIAGKDTNSLYGKMLEYKRSTKFSDIMVRLAHGYTDAQLRQLAIYFDGLPEH